MTFPGSPKLLKGAILGLDPMNPVASIIIFQYNPKNLNRNLHKLDRNLNFHHLAEFP